MALSHRNPAVIHHLDPSFKILRQHLRGGTRGAQPCGHGDVDNLPVLPQQAIPHIQQITRRRLRRGHVSSLNQSVIELLLGDIQPLVEDFPIDMDRHRDDGHSHRSPLFHADSAVAVGHDRHVSHRIGTSFLISR